MAGVDTESSQRHRRLWSQELGVRGVVALLLLGFNEFVGAGHASLRILALVALLINAPYYLIAATGWRPRAQAYMRMLVDVGLLTAGLFDAGGIAAAQSLSVYVIVPVYAALRLSSIASLLATAFATVAYLAVIGAQSVGWLPTLRAPLPNARGIVIFNLLILNVVGLMTAWLAERYRRSRREVRALYGELERAHDAAQRLTGEIQRTSRLYALGEVVAGVTHEMRNVMMAALSHSHLLRRRLREADGEVLGHAHEIERSLITASRILNNVLETARRPSTERMRISPAEVIGRIVELKGYDVRRDGIELRVELPPALPAVLVVPFQLEQVLLNLVSNAHDALRGVREGATITIAGQADDARVAIEVRDNGAGIPLTALPRIFEPFFTTKAAGTGLGLAISASIVRDAGGELTAANAPEGGAVFRLALPVAS